MWQVFNVIQKKFIKTKLKKTHKIVLTIINKSTAKLRAYLYVVNGH